MRFSIVQGLLKIADIAGNIADIVAGGTAGPGPGVGESTHGKKRLATQATLVGADGVYEVDIIRQEGKNRIATVLPENITILLGRSQLYDMMNASGWMRYGIYDHVTIAVTGTLATLSFYQDGALLGRAYVDFTNSDVWDLVLARYLDLDDGNPILLDDGTEVNMD